MKGVAMVLAVAIIVQVVGAGPVKKSHVKPLQSNGWHDFKAFHGKRYRDPTEEQMRRQIWDQRKSRVDLHNAEAAKGKHSYTMALNHLSDKSDKELKSLARTVPPKNRPIQNPVTPILLTTSNATTVTLPGSVDYRQNACLPAVKDQESCGACWAFAATTPIEYAHCTKTGKAVVLSGPAEYNEGCNGGWYGGAWEYILEAPGQARAAEYPYKSTNGTCSYLSSTLSVSLRDYSWIPVRNETAIRTVLATNGPVATAIHIVPSIFSYGAGIYSETNCSSDGYTVDHAVVIVGYGVQNSIPYWIVRNSWSPSWGEAGYILMKRGTNQCNIEAWPAYPIL